MRLRSMFTALVTGLLLVGSVWAGVGLAPVDKVATPAVTGGTTAGGIGSLDVGTAETLGTDEVFVGASKISLEPTPDAASGEIWVRDRDACLPAGLREETLNDPLAGQAHVADWRNPWIENSNCIYMGGYGIGPTNPVLTWDTQYGLWVRTTVFTDAAGDTLSMTLLDAEGYFGDYNKMCGTGEPRCGAFNIAEDMAAELSAASGLPIKPDGFIVASTHSHTSLDLIGGWGGVPGWYMDQVATSIKDSIRQAFANRKAARLEAGDTLARQFNGERRSKYHSAEDPSINWIRAIGRDDRVIATVGTFATHPVSFNEELGIGHGDFPPVFAAQAEANQGGGMATIFQAGLGNMTGGPKWEPKGKGIADAIPAVGTGTPVPNPDVRVKREYWDQPVTNLPLGSLGAGGFFDKPFQAGPVTVEAGKSSEAPCRSASAMSAKVSVTAAKIGSVIVTAAPGETFANFSNTIEERSPITSLAVGQANDAVGYMPQSFETDHPARQGLGFVATPYFEYEDAYSIDACFGDKALETTLKLLGEI